MNSHFISGLKIKISGIAGLVFLFLISALLIFPDFFGRMESALYDQRIRLAGPVQPSPDIVLLNIDDASLRELGKWPLDRGVHARVMETLSRCEAGPIIYDIVFHGRGSTKGDADLAKAIQRSGRIYLPAGFSLTHADEIIDLNINEYQEAMAKSLLATQIPDISRVLQADRSFLPLPSLADRAKAIGHISASPDADGVLRRIPLAIGINGNPLPSIDLEAAMHVLGISAVNWKNNTFELVNKEKIIRIPVDEQGRMTVNFAGRWGQGFTQLSFHDVIAASGDPEAEGDLRELIRNKLVFVGLTSSGSTDIGPTPVGKAEPLVTIHSNGVNTILQQAFITTVPEWMNILAGAVMVVIICLLAANFGPRSFVLASSALLFIYAAGNTILFSTTGVLFNLSGTIYVSMSCFLVALGLKSLLLFAENEARRIESEKLQIQLDAAARIQSHFWPEIPVLGDGDKIFAYSSPALFVGGDLYDFIPLQDGSWIIYLADVSGKGLPAALVMASAWTQIRSSSARHCNPAELVTAVNKNLYPFLERDSNFVTILLLRYFPDSGRLQYVNGGHMQPLIINENGVREVEGQTSMPLGIFDETEYTMAETILQPGESCVMMSDGVTEAENNEKKLFGDDKVLQTLTASPFETRGEHLAQEVKKWRNGIEQNDDTTIVEVRRG